MTYLKKHKDKKCPRINKRIKKYNRTDIPIATVNLNSLNSVP